MVELYFPNGCNTCNGNVELIEDKRIYKCLDCGAYVTYHHKTTDFSRMYEPLGYLADEEINRLRKDLKSAIVFFWRHRRSIQTDRYGLLFTAPINVVYNKFVVKVDYESDQEYGYSIKKKDDLVNMFLIDICKHAVFKKEELIPVRNREKTYVWLASELGMPAKGFSIGLLTSKQLKRSIEICHENQQRINAITVGDNEWFDRDQE